jgi:hypothetical protein
MGISEEMDMDEKKEWQRENQHLIIEEMLGPVGFRDGSLNHVISLS